MVNISFLHKLLPMPLSHHPCLNRIANTLFQHINDIFPFDFIQYFVQFINICLSVKAKSSLINLSTNKFEIVIEIVEWFQCFAYY